MPVFLNNIYLIYKIKWINNTGNIGTQILNRKRKLTIDMVRNLANKLNLSASLLIKDYQLAQ